MPAWLTDDRVIALGVLAGALVLTGERTTWRVLRVVVTIAHEGGHAVAAVLVRRELAGIRLHSDTSGVTLSRGRPTGPGMVFTALAGYPAPCLLGAGLAGLIGLDLVAVLLWLLLVLLILLFLQIRNVFGAVSVVAVAAATAGVLARGTPRVAFGFACAVTWLLLVGGLRAVAELARSRRHQRRGRGRGPSSDADQLAWLTGVPAIAWVALFGVVAVVALVAGGWLMLR